ncbi:MAG: branched-chain amino acid ABC transporter permease [Oscillospiraceae bacterium]|nr:branched-chain amino acid ABC transporter permease [Oscillospiraceae bacterium]
MKQPVLKGKLSLLILCVLFFVLPLALNSRSWVDLFITIVVNMVGAVALRLIVISGNLSFAQGAFMGVGAYTAGMLAVYLNVPIWLSIPAGAIMATIVGLITGWPFARLKSVYFSMGTMFMGQALMLMISAWPLAGGALGLQRIPSLTSALSGVADVLHLKGYQACYYLIFLLALFCLVIMYRMEHCRIGTTLRALAQSEEVAASIGVNPTFYRLLAVGTSCFCMGLIGGVQSHYLTTISYSSYGMNTTLWIIMYMMIGGTGKFVGPLYGAIVISIVQGIANLLTSLSGSSNNESFVAFAHWLGANSAYTPFLTAAVLLVVAYLLPGGLVGIPDTIRANRARRAEKKEAAEIAKGGSK